MPKVQSQPTPYGLGTSPTRPIDDRLWEILQALGPIRPGTILPRLPNVTVEVLPQSPGGVEVSLVVFHEEDYREEDLTTIGPGESWGYRLTPYHDVQWTEPYEMLMFKPASAQGAFFKVIEGGYLGDGQVFARQASPYWDAHDSMVERVYLYAPGPPGRNVYLFRDWMFVYGHYIIA